MSEDERTKRKDRNLRIIKFILCNRFKKYENMVHNPVVDKDGVEVWYGFHACCCAEPDAIC